MERPSHAEVQESMWRMIIEANRAKDELKEKLEKKVEDLKRQEQTLADWEHHLDVHERWLDNDDDGLSKLMRDLRLKESVIVNKDDEIRRMRREMDNHIMRAREDVQREVQVGVFVLDKMYFVCFFV